VGKVLGYVLTGFLILFVAGIILVGFNTLSDYNRKEKKYETSIAVKNLKANLVSINKKADAYISTRKDGEIRAADILEALIEYRKFYISTKALSDRNGHIDLLQEIDTQNWTIRYKKVRIGTREFHKAIKRSISILKTYLRRVYLGDIKK